MRACPRAIQRRDNDTADCIRVHAASHRPFPSYAIPDCILYDVFGSRLVEADGSALPACGPARAHRARPRSRPAD